MAVVRWNFPNGSNGDPLTAALAGADSENFTGGTATLSNDRSISGISSLSARFLLQEGGHFWVSKDGLSATSYAYDLYVNVATRLGGNVFVAWAGNGSAPRSLGVMFGGSQNTIGLRDSDGDIWSGTSGVIPDNTWIRISVFGTCGVGTGTAKLAWYYGSDTEPAEESPLLTGLNTQTSIDRIRIGGKAASSSIASGDIYIGSWAYDTSATDFIPPIGAESPAATWQRRQSGVWVPASVQMRTSGSWQLKDPSVK